MKTLARAPLMFLAGLSLLAGLAAALQLLGLPVVDPPRLAASHGILMTLGFVGALIALERAAALGRIAGYAAPASLAIGALTCATPAPHLLGRAILVAGTAAFTALYLPLWRRRPDDATLVQALGAVSATAAATLWIGGVEIPRLAPWLLAFLVLTIIGERLELARIEITTRTETLVLVLAAALLVTAATALLWPRATWVFGAALAALAVVMGAADVARRTARTAGQRAFSGRLMLAGYGWLLLGAALIATSPAALAGARYDAALHSVFLGFVMSMVYAHAPTILPAVLRIRLPYHPVMYVPAVLLHAGLALRVAADGLSSRLDWQIGGVTTVASVLLFLLTAAGTALTARSPR